MRLGGRRNAAAARVDEVNKLGNNRMVLSRQRPGILLSRGRARLQRPLRTMRSQDGCGSATVRRASAVEAMRI